MVKNSIYNLSKRLHFCHIAADRATWLEGEIARWCEHHYHEQGGFDSGHGDVFLDLDAFNPGRAYCESFGYIEVFPPLEGKAM